MGSKELYLPLAKEEVNKRWGGKYILSKDETTEDGVVYRGQVNHINALLKVFRKSPIAVDTSETGTGKTLSWCVIARRFNVPMFVVCPKSAINVWETFSDLCGVDCITITYESLSGKALKHGLLTYDRTDNKYYPTDRLLDLVDDGVMIIFDEVHKIKNDTNRSKCAHTVIQSVINDNPKWKTWCGLLSATAIDKPDTVLMLYRSMGFWSNTPLTKHVPGRPRNYDGFLEIINNLSRIFAPGEVDFSEADNLMDNKATKEELSGYLFELWRDSISKKMISEMVQSPTEFTIEFANGYYEIKDPDELKEIKMAIDEVADAVGFNARTGETKVDNQNLGALTKAEQHLHAAYVPMAIRVIRKILKTVPGAKVIFFTRFIGEFMDPVVEHLEEKGFTVLTLHGKMNDQDRIDTIDEFNGDNDSNILIASLQLGGTSISIHDTIGGRPRYSFVIPNYRYTDTVQCMGRTKRRGIQSNGYWRLIFPYLGSADVMTGIINSMARKHTIHGSSVPERILKGGPLPGKLPMYLEQIPGYKIQTLEANYEYEKTNSENYNKEKKIIFKREPKEPGDEKKKRTSRKVPEPVEESEPSERSRSSRQSERTEERSEATEQSESKERGEGSVKKIAGNILTYDGLIGHHVNMKSEPGQEQELAKDIAKKWPKYNFYKRVPKEDRELGTSWIIGVVACLISQINPGKPSSGDTQSIREKAFKDALEDLIGNMKASSWDSIAFHVGQVGSGLDGIDWGNYYTMIYKWAMRHKIDVLIYFDK